MASRLLEHVRASGRLLGFGVLTLGAGSLQLIGGAILGAGARSQRFRNAVLQTWARSLTRLLKLDIAVEGKALDQPHLLACNHLGYLDVVAIGAHFPGTFVAKSEVASWPLLGRVCQWSGTIFVERRRRSGLLPAVHAIRDRLAAGENVVVFPEGTSSPGRSVIPFRAGLFEAAVQAKVPVANATLSYRVADDEESAETSVCWWGDMPFLSHLYGLLRHRKIDVRLQFSSKVLNHPDRAALALDSHAAISSQLPRPSAALENRHGQVQRIAGQCCLLLRQAEQLIDEIGAERFNWCPPGFGRSTIGDQLRHCLDYFSCLASGLQNGAVDYDRRERSAEVAQSADQARKRIQQVIQRFDSEIAFLPSIPLRVRMEEPDPDLRVGWNDSDLARELRFLESHTIHHFAMIAFNLRLQGIEVPEGFGVAPSTLREWTRQSIA